MSPDSRVNVSILEALARRIRELEEVVDEEVDYHRKSQAMQALKGVREEYESLRDEGE